MTDHPAPLALLRAMVDAADRDLLQVIARRMALVALGDSSDFGEFVVLQQDLQPGSHHMSEAYSS